MFVRESVPVDRAVQMTGDERLAGRAAKQQRQLSKLF
jgi:hypothetical protein